MRNFRKQYSTQQECAHAWAHGLSKNGRSSNLYFEGPVIYSYGEHFPIARIHNGTVYVTDRKYSQTTSCHVSISISAVSHLNHVFVHYVPEGDGKPAKDKQFISQNIDHWISEFSTLFELYEINTKKKSILAKINEIHFNLINFIESLNIKPSRSLQMLLENISQHAVLDFKKSEKRRISANDKRQQKSKLQKFSNAVEKWKKGETQRINLSHPIDMDISYLRINQQTGVIETSKGITVTYKDAKALYIYIRRFLSSPKEKPSFNIAGFNVSNINQNFLKVGCHKIAMEEVELVAQELGWSTV